MSRLFLVILSHWLAVFSTTLPVAGDEAATREVVSRYLTAYTARDVAMLRGFYGSQTVLRDPTLAQLIPGTREARGADAIVAWLQNRANTLEAHLEIERSMVVGSLVVVEGTLQMRGSFDLESHGVFILRIEEGRVIEHTEYHDYPAMREQYVAQGGDAEKFAALLNGSGSPPPEPVALKPTVQPAVQPTVQPTVQPAVQPAVQAADDGAALTLDQIRTLTVIPVLTDGKPDDELTAMLAAQIREKKPRFELVSEREVVVRFPDPSSFSSAADLGLLLAAARRAGAQAIVLAQASSYRAQNEHGNRLRLKIVEVNQGEVVWSGGGWGTGGVAPEAAKKRSVVDAVRQIP